MFGGAQNVFGRRRVNAREVNVRIVHKNIESKRKINTRLNAFKVGKRVIEMF